MTLGEAKSIADSVCGPDACPTRDPTLLKMAYSRLERTMMNGGVQNSAKATDRLERRMRALRVAIVTNKD